MKKKRIIVILAIIIVLLISTTAFLVTLQRLDKTGKRPFKNIITEETVERITISRDDSEEIELKPDSQAFLLAWSFANEMTVYTPPRLFFGLDSRDGTIGSLGGEGNGIITYYLKDGSIHTIQPDGSENTAPQQTDEYIYLDGERHYIMKEVRGYYYIKVDGKRYDVRERSIQSEFERLIKDNLK